MDVPWPYIDAVHSEPEGSTTGALLPGLHTLFVGEEVGADERGVLATDEGFVRGGVTAGGGGSRCRGGPHPSLGTVPVLVPVAPGGGQQEPQQRLKEAGNKV